MPAYGLYARAVRGLKLQNIGFQVRMPDQRPAMIFDRVTDAAVNGLSVEADPSAESALRLIACEDVLFGEPRLLTRTQSFLQVEGSQTRAIVVDGGDISKADVPLTFRGGANKDGVRVRG
jgi:hypothetical protein